MIMPSAFSCTAQPDCVYKGHVIHLSFFQACYIFCIAANNKCLLAKYPAGKNRFKMQQLIL